MTNPSAWDTLLCPAGTDSYYQVIASYDTIVAHILDVTTTNTFELFWFILCSMQNVDIRRCISHLSQPTVVDEEDPRGIYIGIERRRSAKHLF